MMVQLGRAVILAFVAYIGYWAIVGKPAQVLRAIKIVYYLLNVFEALVIQHATV
jgi:hypothetical protein